MRVAKDQDVSRGGLGCERTQTRTTKDGLYMAFDIVLTCDGANVRVVFSRSREVFIAAPKEPLAHPQDGIQHQGGACGTDRRMRLTPGSPADLPDSFGAVFGGDKEVHVAAGLATTGAVNPQARPDQQAAACGSCQAVLLRGEVPDRAAFVAGRLSRTREIRMERRFSFPKSREFEQGAPLYYSRRGGVTPTGPYKKLEETCTTSLRASPHQGPTGGSILRVKAPHHLIPNVTGTIRVTIRPVLA
jgi:hypothetical protein